MATTDKRVIEDLTKHICTELEQTLNMHMRIAGHMLPADELAGIMIRIATGMSSGCILFALQSRKDEVAADSLYDLISTSLASIVTAAKPMVLHQLAEREAAAREAA
jgi:hypothetical protein